MAEKIIISFKATGDKRLQQSMLRLAATQGILEKNTAQMNRALDRLAAAFGRSTRRSRLLNNTFATLRSKILLFSFAMSLGGRQLLEFARNAARVESMEVAFANLLNATENQDVAFQKLRDATDGTMSKFDLFQQANNAMVLGITRNSDEMAKMFDMAQRLGETLGVDTRRSVESLVTGIGRQSRLMLDNIGIIVRTEKAYEEYAASIEKSASELTDIEKKQAFFNAAMTAAEEKLKRVGEETDTPIKAFNRFAASAQDLTNSIGQDFLSALQPALNTFAKLFDVLQNINFAKVAQHATALAIGIASTTKAGRASIKTMRGLASSMMGLTAATNASRIAFAKLRRATIVMALVEAGFFALSKVFNFFGQQVKKTDEETSAFNKTLDDLRKENTFGEYAQQIAAAGNDVAALENIFDNIKNKVDEFDTQIKSLTDNPVDEFVKSFSSLGTFGVVSQFAPNPEFPKQLQLIKDLTSEKNKEDQIAANLSQMIIGLEAQRLAKAVSVIPNLEKELQLLQLKTEFDGIQLAVEQELLKVTHESLPLNDFELMQMRMKIITIEELKKKLKEELQAERDLQSEKTRNLALAERLIASNLTEEESLNNQIENLEKFSNTAGLTADEIKLINDGILILKKRLEEIEPKISEMAQLFLDVGKALQGGLEQSINRFLDTGKGKFKDFADAVIKEVQRIVVEMAALKIVGFLFPSLVPKQKLHSGGMVQGFNQGGMITMPNYHSGGNVDDVPIMAQEGEFVMRRSAVESIGAENLARMNNTGQSGGVNITFSGNVMSRDFIENEAIPKIKDAVRRGADIGVS